MPNRKTRRSVRVARASGAAPKRIPHRLMAEAISELATRVERLERASERATPQQPAPAPSPDKVG